MKAVDHIGLGERLESKQIVDRRPPVPGGDDRVLGGPLPDGGHELRLDPGPAIPIPELRLVQHLEEHALGIRDREMPGQRPPEIGEGFDLHVIGLELLLELARGVDVDDHGETIGEDQRHGLIQSAEMLRRDHVRLFGPPQRDRIDVQAEVIEPERRDEGEIRRRGVRRQMFLGIPLRVHHLREPVARVDPPLQLGQPCIQPGHPWRVPRCRATEGGLLSFGNGAGAWHAHENAEGETQGEAEHLRWHDVCV
jgi:hypothetical protein